jgi:hypothetical protein
VAQEKLVRTGPRRTVVIVGAGLGILVGLTTVLLSRFQIDIVITEASSSMPLATVEPLPSPVTPNAIATPTRSSPLWNPNPEVPSNPVTGVLRVSNQTGYPVRLVLLAANDTSANEAENNSTYAAPAHWDFAPAEGSSQGLILSLPEGTLTVKPGDILTAFSLDGSQVYWGPHVVGSTGQPTWNRRVSEWQLILKP